MPKIVVTVLLALFVLTGCQAAPCPEQQVKIVYVQQQDSPGIIGINTIEPVFLHRGNYTQSRLDLLEQVATELNIPHFIGPARSDACDQPGAQCDFKGMAGAFYTQKGVSLEAFWDLVRAREKAG
ncbi:hypothetical protein COY32_01165 [candidate division WWE3 bacterium CG_4_10_14_0_2_um_filter_41_14]|uniref:Uncharacterized protein n=1 Tax=candidate division WWE3 bacterium CG_4_10_14_0_2_um_filter_41_14 TaxID=1975072 RepID=A0A2M7TL47_UNCKA|nr:MAG: hypothetical protein COY32_01165 [candidate division WWE3 bacterium CG_4_10_14_0_2_um_filter_41_14]